eukprot:2963948-Amphidinium_carterae.1
MIIKDLSLLEKTAIHFAASSASDMNGEHAGIKVHVTVRTSPYIDKPGDCLADDRTTVGHRKDDSSEKPVFAQTDNWRSGRPKSMNGLTVRLSVERLAFVPWPGRLERHTRRDYMSS